MERGHRLQAASAETTHQLQKATRIRGDNRFRLGGKQLFYLAIAKLTGRLRIQKIVDTGRTTAQACLFDSYDLKPGNRREQPGRGCS